MKRGTSLYLEVDLVKGAKVQGINISQLVNEALRQKLEDSKQTQLEQSALTKAILTSGLQILRGLKKAKSEQYTKYLIRLIEKMKERDRIITKREIEEML